MKVAVVLLFAMQAFSQCASIRQAASNNSVAHNSYIAANHLRINELATRSRWYWDDAGFSGLPPTPIEREALFSTVNDFAPVSVSWTLTGIHKKVPTFNVVGFDVKPGLQEFNPDSRYGTMDRPRLWNRASHAIASALRY